VFNYLADSYTIYSSSALAAQSFMRNVFGAGFPLFSIQMNNKLGFDWSMSLLGIAILRLVSDSGFIGLALSVTPYVLMFYGPQIRYIPIHTGTDPDRDRSRFSKKVLASRRTT
jgi:hypothetical protein